MRKATANPASVNGIRKIGRFAAMQALAKNGVLVLWPGMLERFLTHRVEGLANYAQLMDTLTSARNAIKVYLEVAAL